MKYIRTKDRVCEFEMELSTMPDLIAVKGEGIGGFVRREDIVKEADTVEELCDEFVDIDNHDYYKISHKNGITYALSKTKRFIGHCDIRLKYIGQIMGAIYTDKGLIYVAKMNKKGELELL